MSNHSRHRERGFVLVTLVGTILPLIILVGAASITMNSRNSRLLDEIAQERALLAAESGIDEAIFQASKAALVSGKPISRQIDSNTSFVVDPTYLRMDGWDNDGDGLVDELDEDVFQIVVVGTYGGISRRLVAYMGPTPGLPPINAAGTIMGIPKKVKIDKNALISGINRDPWTPILPWKDGNPLPPAPAMAPGTPQAGISIMAPNTTADLLAKLEIKDGGVLEGLGAAPSLGVQGGSMDLNALINSIRSSADIVLNKKKVKNQVIGDYATGDLKIVFRNGKLDFRNGSMGAGILLVTDDLKMKEGSRWDGLIIAFGKCKIEKGSVVNGAVILGPKLGDLDKKDDDGSYGEMKLEVKKSSVLQFSTPVLTTVGKLLPGKFVVFNGWQEISRH